MTIFGSGNEQKFLFKIADIELGVLDFSAQEELSSPFIVYLTVVSEDEIDFDDVIGKDALLTLLGDDKDRYFHGIVSEFMHTGGKGRFYVYRTKVVPSIWLLSLEQDCRIFQNLSVPDIVKKILKDRQITSDTYSFRLQKEYQPRDYCVQYRETDLNFVSRLLEEEGIFYFFEHSKDKHTLVLGDSTINYQPIAGEAEVVFNRTVDMVPDEECVFDFNLSRQIQTGKVTLKDFNFNRPSLDLTTEKQADSFSELEQYDYPGEYLEQERGKSLAEVRLQEAMMFKDYAEGQSVCPRFLPAFTFTLADHELENLNQEYILIETHHSGSQPQALEEEATEGQHADYSNQFMAVPSTVVIRPARRTPKPIMEGVQTAIVVGPSGEEIYTDEHGRVKVQFHWDREGKRNEKSSCWIRVSHGWAGAGWGIIFIPRIGHEVIVDFIEGDPDRPIITGRVYHSTNTPPYPLPDEKTKSTIKSDSSLGGGGSNEFRFEDKKGQEEIFLHGQKDWTIAIENDKNQTVGNNETLSVGNNRDKKVGNNQSETIGSNKTIKVGANHTETIGSNMSLKVGSNQTETIGINCAETIGAAKELTIGAAYQVTVGAAMNETIGAAKAEEIGAVKSVNVGTDSSENIGKNKSVDAGKDISMSSGKKMSFSAGDDFAILGNKKGVIEIKDQLTIKCGKASITLKKNGDIAIKGKKINIKGSGNIVMKGKKILEN